MLNGNETSNKEYNNLKDKYEQLLKNNEKTNKEVNELKENNDKLLKDKNKLNEEKISLENDYKTLKDNYINIENDYKKLKEDYNKLKEEYNELIKNGNIGRTQQIVEVKTTTKITKNIDGGEEKKEIIEKKELGPLKPKTNLNVKSKTVHELIDQINNNILNNDNNSNINKEVTNNEIIIQKKEITRSVDDAKKNERLNKALLRARKKQKNTDDSADGSVNKSEKVSNLAKLLEENMQKKSNIQDGNNNDIVVEKIEVNDNIEDMIENLPLSQSIKKKKPLKKNFDNNE